METQSQTENSGIKEGYGTPSQFSAQSKSPFEGDQTESKGRTEIRIDDIWGKFPIVTSIPTWVPRTFNESIAIDSSTAKIYYYDYTNNTWRTVYPDGVGGDASTNTATSVDSEIALFSSTTGKLLKRATTTGILKATAGVIAAATAGTDYLDSYAFLMGLYSSFNNYWTTDSYPIDADLGWTISAAGGGLTNRGTGASISATGTVNAYISLACSNSNSAGTLQWSTGPTIRMKYMYLTERTSQGTTPLAGTDRANFHGFAGTTSAAATGDITDVTDRIGFIHYNNLLYTVTANGSAVTVTSLGGEPGTATPKEFMIIADVGASVGFYVNGTLVATHTTNLPTAASTIYINFSSYDAATSSTGFFVGNPKVSVKIA